MKRLFERSGVPEEKMEHFDAAFEMNAGENATLLASNISSGRNFNIETPDVVIKVNPERMDTDRNQNNRRQTMPCHHSKRSRRSKRNQCAHHVPLRGRRSTAGRDYLRKNRTALPASFVRSADACRFPCRKGWMQDGTAGLFGADATSKIGCF